MISSTPGRSCVHESPPDHRLSTVEQLFEESLIHPAESLGARRLFSGSTAASGPVEAGPWGAGLAGCGVRCCYVDGGAGPPSMMSVHVPDRRRARCCFGFST